MTEPSAGAEPTDAPVAPSGATQNAAQNATQNPALSVILVTDEGGGGLDKILTCLAGQSIADRLEIVIGAATPETVTFAPQQCAAFQALRVIQADTITSATARATAIRAATAPFVALAEDHCFPTRTDWAARLLKGLQAGHAVVGPVLRNANPKTRISWANLAVEYSPWLSAPQAAPALFLPGHNAAYRRDLLLDYGDALADALEAEWVMHAAFRQQGHTLLLDPEITVAHLNYSRIGRSLKLQFLAGRMFATSRASGWGWPRRLGFALLSPAIPVKRFISITRDVLRVHDDRWQLISAMPMAFLLLVASGIGEGLGYAFGDGGRRNALAHMEYRRWQNLKPDEVHLARQSN